MDNGTYEELRITGTYLTHSGLSGCVNGVSVAGSLIEGYVNSASDMIVLTFRWQLKDNHCSSGFGNLNGTPVPVPTPTPTPSSTSTPAPSPNPTQSDLPMEPDNNLSHNLIFLNSQTGDWIGGGQTRTFDVVAGDTFTATRNYNNGVSIQYHSAAYSNSWTLDFASGDNSELIPGVYEGAERFAFKSPGKPGLEVGGDGRGCNTISGTFTVIEVSYGAGSSVNSFWAEFEQHCGNNQAALFGSVRFNAGPPLP